MSEPNRHSGIRRFLRFFERLLKIILLFLLAIEKLMDFFR
jgi:hypothetical protein